MNINIIDTHLNNKLNEKTIEYLVGNGFAINRYDIKDTEKRYRQLTDKGRMLKECGSIAVYNSWEQEEKRRKDLRAQENDTLRQTNIINGKIQQRLLTINRWIVIGTIVQAISAFVMLFVGVLKNYHWSGSVEFWTVLFVFLLGTIAVATVLLIVNRLL